MDSSSYVPLEPGKAYVQQQKAKFEASKISVLIPVHNEAGNINILYTEIIDTMCKFNNEVQHFKET